MWQKKFGKIVDLMKHEKYILDIGCGIGYLYNFLLKNFSDNFIYYGIDSDFNTLKMAKKRGIQALLADANKLPIKNKSISCCILSEVIEHLQNPDKSLSEAFRVLKKNKFVIIVVPNDLNFKLMSCILFKFNTAFKDRGHVHKFTYKLLYLCRKYGEISAEYGIPLNFPFSLCLNYIVKVEKL